MDEGWEKAMTAEDYYLAGMEHFSEDRLDEAIGQFRKAVQVDPSYGDAFHALAMSHHHKGEYDSAIEWGERYRDLDPDSPLAYTSLSMFYQAKGMIEKAEEMGALAAQAAARQKG